MRTKSPFKLSASDETNRLGEIYRAAALLICEKGYDATSMNDIAEAVGLTKAGIYHHIEGKKDLLFSIMNFGMDELDEGSQEKVLRAIEQGHVDDEDWRGVSGRHHAYNQDPASVLADLT